MSVTSLVLFDQWRLEMETLYHGEWFDLWEVRRLAEYLRFEGFWNVSGMSNYEVLYWAENHSHTCAKSLASIGRVDV
jgi:hypothetical protein